MTERRALSIAVLGDGSWGTTFAIHLAELRHSVLLWSAFPQQAADMRRDRENTRFLPGYAFPDTLSVTDDIDEAVAFADFLICAIPTQYIRASLDRITVPIPPDLGIVSLAKGIENDTLLRTTQVIADVRPFRIVGGLWGPSHAEEVAKKLPTTLVATANDMDFASRVQRAASADYLRIYTNEDAVGVELGGALKNVIAIAAGVLEGLGFGDNAKSALITRGLAEMARLGVAMGAKPITFMGLAGVGDLITTCVSPFGRNRHVGLEIGRGKTLEQVLSEMTMVAEGVATCQSVNALAKKNSVEMPISDAVCDVLFNGVDPKQATIRLMRRELKDEMRGVEL